MWDILRCKQMGCFVSAIGVQAVILVLIVYVETVWWKYECANGVDFEGMNEVWSVLCRQRQFHGVEGSKKQFYEEMKFVNSGVWSQ